MAGAGTAPYQASWTANSRLSPSHSSLAFEARAAVNPTQPFPHHWDQLCIPTTSKSDWGAPQGLELPGDVPVHWQMPMELNPTPVEELEPPCVPR